MFPRNIPHTLRTTMTMVDMEMSQQRFGKHTWHAELLLNERIALRAVCVGE
jgi:hypothetical protein